MAKVVANNRNDVRVSRTRKIVLYLVLPPLLLATACALVVFFYLRFHKPVEMDLTPRGFSLSTIEITEGESVNFVNQSNVMQVLCLGVDKVCDVNAVAPTVLKTPGFRLQPGSSINVDFEQYGTYVITSANVKGVNLTITVDQGG